MAVVNGGAGNEVLFGTSGNDTVNGLGGSDTLLGLGGNDTLNGGDGDDLLLSPFGSTELLNGDSGADTAAIEGTGLADDVDLATAVTDVLVTRSGFPGGLRLRAVETLIVSTGEGIDTLDVPSITGTDLAAGRVVFEGGADSDSLRGGGTAVALTLRWLREADGSHGGSDNMEGGSNTQDLFQVIDESALGGSWSAWSIGNSISVDALSLGVGSDASNIERVQFDLGAGADTVTLYQDQTGVLFRAVVNTGGGNDTIDASPFDTDPSDPDVFLGPNDLPGVLEADGGTGDDTITGGEGDDSLRGGPGNDLLAGTRGSDSYFVDAAGDVVQDGAGQGTLDRVFASVSYTLTAGAEIEVFSTDNHSGTGAINLTGNALGNNIIGNDGNNSLDGRGGIDKLTGRLGNDFYFVDNAADDIVEAAGQGAADRVFSSSVTYALGAGDEIEIMSTTNHAGVGAQNLTGNELANTIMGNDGTNVLAGRGGNDTLTGRLGTDFFLFDTPLNAATNLDQITDFNVADDAVRLDDAVFTTLALGALTAGAFRTGAAATEADDRIIYNNATGALIYDTNGNVAGGATQFATLTAGLAITAGDFFVV